MSRIGVALMAAALLILAACGQAKKLTPDELTQQQDAIIKEIGQVYGFRDVSVNPDVPPTIDNGKITVQEVNVLIGEERPGDQGECLYIAVWRPGKKPDVYAPGANATLIREETTYAEIEANAKNLGLEHCFAA